MPVMTISQIFYPDILLAQKHSYPKGVHLKQDYTKSQLPVIHVLTDNSMP